MRKEEFLKQLNKALHGLERTERARTVQYYREILEDRMEDGVPEEEAVAGMEPVEEIAAGILAEQGVAAKQRQGGWSLALILLGSPMWLVMFAVVAAVVIAMYVAAWSVIIALFSAVAALGACALGGVLGMCLFASSHPLTGLFLLGSGFVCAAFGIALFFPVLTLAKWLVRGTMETSKRLWQCVVRRKKGEAA